MQKKVAVLNKASLIVNKITRYYQKPTKLKGIGFNLDGSLRVPFGSLSMSGTKRIFVKDTRYSKFVSDKGKRSVDRQNS